MIVNDLNFVGLAASPKEAYTPLIIDADAVLTLTVALQCFQARFPGGTIKSCRERARWR